MKGLERDHACVETCNYHSFFSYVVLNLVVYNTFFIIIVRRYLEDQVSYSKYPDGEHFITSPKGPFYKRIQMSREVCLLDSNLTVKNDGEVEG